MTPCGRPDDTTEQFERDLRDLVSRADPVPDDVKAEARRALRETPAGDSELLDLVYDSITDAEIAVVTGETPARSLSFSGGGVRLEVRVDSGDDRLTRLTGWVIPIAPRAATLRTEQDEVSLAVAADGSFCRGELGRAPVRIGLEVRLDGETRRFHSSWFVL